MIAVARVANRLVWMEGVQCFEEAGQTVARFCAGEGVSVPSFYQWRLKLSCDSVPQTAQTLRHAQVRPNEPIAKFLPVQVPVLIILRGLTHGRSVSISVVFGNNRNSENLLGENLSRDQRTTSSERTKLPSVELYGGVSVALEVRNSLMGFQ